MGASDCCEKKMYTEVPGLTVYVVVGVHLVLTLEVRCEAAKYQQSTELDLHLKSLGLISMSSAWGPSTPSARIRWRKIYLCLPPGTWYRIWMGPRHGLKQNLAMEALKRGPTH
eukprot:CAMPEP_0180763458 /NCGR_PEP_ID=MMETSP1038_2-20121128/37920_1 /TAXON_ID=632150 /ORGANISM="Azadinium spinosum, Strain 3D9" /LENGTH=112 /DNA_ID=CAMNT_0022797799 /DNA_START=182 /DNA_END=521 /DNA_ORIENTATION=-